MTRALVALTLLACGRPAPATMEEVRPSELASSSLRDVDACLATHFEALANTAPGASEGRGYALDGIRLPAGEDLAASLDVELEREEAPTAERVEAALRVPGDRELGPRENAALRAIAPRVVSCTPVRIELYLADHGVALLDRTNGEALWLHVES